ncbi:MAG: VanZ family protein [Thermoguttaceae bacterium]|jgi:glycopeptide antibiotics resistance protein
MRILARFTCLCYWLLLTVLLLVPNPAALVGLRAVPTFPWGKFGVHLIAFTILAVLVHASRWPKRLCWPLIVFLVLYGITTESLQLFVPHRTARVMDGIENILGIAAGSGIYWLVQRLVQPLTKLSLAAELVRHAAETDLARAEHLERNGG